MAIKILVIDDDRINTEIIYKNLKDRGFEIFAANDGNVGLDIAQEEHPDIIILDVEMPEMDGYTFMNNMHEIENLKSTPVIVLTSHEDMQPIFELKGVKDYLIKPVDFDVLCEKINNCLSK